MLIIFPDCGVDQGGVIDDVFPGRSVAVAHLEQVQAGAGEGEVSVCVVVTSDTAQTFPRALSQGDYNLHGMDRTGC